MRRFLHALNPAHLAGLPWDIFVPAAAVGAGMAIVAASGPWGVVAGIAAGLAGCVYAWRGER